MNSSGIKRGLATAAITALAVTGVPAIANATPIDTQVGAGNVVLFSQFNTGNEASVKNDGQNSTIRLEAGAGSDVTAITFQYSLDSGTTFVNIATVNRNDDGAFSHEWDASALAGATAIIRATGLVGVTPVNDDQASVEILGGGATADSVNLNAGTNLGVFQQPYAPNQNQVIVSGTTSATTGNVDVSRRNGTGAVAGTVLAAPVVVAQGATTGTFRGVLDVTGYPFSGDGSADQLVVGAERDTDDVEAYTLYKQVITTVTATAAATSVPSPSTAAITVTVTDQNQAPIAGAQVATGNGTVIGLTNSLGQVTTTQGAGTSYYYANATTSAPYEAELGDKRSADVTVTQYNATPRSLAVTSIDGAAFDRDEHVTGDISVQVKDQAANNLDVNDSQDFRYYWVVTPFGGGAAVRYPLVTATPNYSEDLTDVAGRFDPVVPAGGSGTYELFGGLTADGGGNNPIASAKLGEFKIGQATITYDEAAPEQAVAGTTEEVVGKVALEDGTGLAGRSVTVGYTGTNAGIVQANDTTGPTRTVVTGANGQFSVVIRDAAAPQPNETGTVTADVVPGTVDNDDPLTTPAVTTVEFVQSLDAGTVVIDAETAISIDGGTKTPGRPVYSNVTVMSGDQDPVTAGIQSVPLSNAEVTLTVDEGFFVDFNKTATPLVVSASELTPDPAPVAGADVGEWKSLGKTITVKTDNAGKAAFVVAIEDNEGFNDDGLVNSTVTAAVGAISDTEVVDWTTANPLNGGAVRVELAPDAIQESGVLPKAPVGDQVFFDVFTEDQFGNLVGGQTVTLSDNTGTASVPANATSNFVTDGDFAATASSAGDQAVTGTWTTDTEVYSNATPPVAGDGPNESLTDAFTINWYAVDYAASTFTLTHSGGDLQPVGSTVTETYTAIDQFGEEISNLHVSFFRSGPDDLQDGEGNFNGLTGQDGKVQYVFQGAKAGTATITAVGRNGSASGDVVEAAQKSDSVTFGTTTPPIPAITAKLSGKDNGAAKDRLTVNAPTVAAGAEVRLFKVIKGKRIQVGNTKGLNASGDATFIVKDANKNQKTKYVAVVVKTDKSQGDTTNPEWVR